jgi:hypothetical protein
MILSLMVEKDPLKRDRNWSRFVAIGRLLIEATRRIGVARAMARTA